MKATLTKTQTLNLLQAYTAISEILSEVISPNDLYKEEFRKSIEQGLRDIKAKRTKKVTSFEDYVS